MAGLDFSLITTGASFVALMVAALLISPIFEVSRRRFRGDLDAGGTFSVSYWSIHRVIITWQVSATAALFLFGTVCVAIISSGSTTTLVERPHWAVSQLNFEMNGYATPDARLMLDGLAAQLRLSSLISGFGVASGLPVAGLSTSQKVGVAEGSETHSRHVAVIASTPGAFRVMNLQLTRGRFYEDNESNSGSRVAIISSDLSETLFGTEDGLGRRLHLYQLTSNPSTSFVIVGVVRSTQDQGRTIPCVFVPFGYWSGNTAFLLTSSSNATTALSENRRAIRHNDRTFAITRDGTATHFLGRRSFIFKHLAGLAFSIGSVALVLAMVGLYGVLSHVVSLRMRELAIRVALGATRQRLLFLVMRQGLAPVLTGLAFGLLIGTLSPIAARSVWTDLKTVPVMAIVGVPLSFLLAGISACARPAIRAASVDPNVALHEL